MRYSQLLISFRSISIIISLTCLLFAGCTGDDKKTSTSDIENLLPFDPSDITQHSYDSETDILYLTIQHEACNRNIKIDLAIEPICGETSPLQCQATLVSQAPDYSCDHEAPVSTNIEVSMKQIKERPASLNIRGKSKALVTILLPPLGELKRLDSEIEDLFYKLTKFSTTATHSSHTSCTKDSDCASVPWSTKYAPLSRCNSYWRTCMGFSDKNSSPDCAPNGVLVNQTTKETLEQFYGNENAKALCDSAAELRWASCNHVSLIGCAGSGGTPTCIDSLCTWVNK